MTGTFLALACVDDRRGGRAVDRVEHQHLGALGQRGLGLLLLLGGVLVGVRVEDLAVRAELLDLGLEQRPVLASRSARSSSPGSRKAILPLLPPLLPPTYCVPLELELLSSLPQAASNIAAASRHTAKRPYFLMRCPPRHLQ